MLAAAERHAREMRRLSAAVLAAVDRGIRRVDPGDVTSSWVPVAAEVARVVTAAQLAAALAADPYLDAVLEEQGIDPERLGQLAPGAFAGATGDGRPLAGLLDHPRIQALTEIGEGAAPVEAVNRAGERLKMLALTAAADAGRSAEAAGLMMRPRAGGYVRVVSPPCCPRCAVLAGRFYRWHAGFARHPRCDCRHVPTDQAHSETLTTDPRRLHESGAIRGLTRAESEALDLGADPSQVINARRGRTSGLETSEGTTRRGFARHRLGPDRRRLSPEGIRRVASDREQAAALLRQHGYIL